MLGTVQFGLPYGVANKAGQPSQEQAFSVLDAAWDCGVRVLDSAQEYGQANHIIAQYHAARAHRFRVINKVLRHPVDIDTVYDSLARERDALRIDAFECVMFHYPASVNNNVPDDFFFQLKARGLSDKSGLSFEDPQEFKRISQRFDLDVVQLPFNPINQCFIAGDFIDSLSMAGIDVHVRSLFLQGLLLAGSIIPPHLAALSPSIDKMSADCKERGLSTITACILYALRRPSVGHLVVGAQNLEQWQQIFSAYQEAGVIADHVTLPWETYACPDYDLVHPVQWAKLKVQSN